MPDRRRSRTTPRERAAAPTECSAAVLALGNPVIWWAGLLALGHNAWRAVVGRDWRSSALLVGYLAGWLPWLLFHNRTIFTLLRDRHGPLPLRDAGDLAGQPARAVRMQHRGRRRWGLMAAGAVVLLA